MDVQLIDGSVTIPLHIVFLVPRLMEIAKNQDARDYYLDKIIKSGYSHEEKISFIEKMKK